ncbi:MAG: hypothetical protein ACR2ML_11140 [Solirubrobacteraceae bacterium]
MEPVSAQRTLVKSPPELWARLSDAAELARHLEEDFGEIRITRSEAERTLAWESEAARGTVELEASGWGTKVTLTAEPAGASPERAAGTVGDIGERPAADPSAEIPDPRPPEPPAPPDPEPPIPPEPPPPPDLPPAALARLQPTLEGKAVERALAPLRRMGFLPRLLGRRKPVPERRRLESSEAPAARRGPVAFAPEPEPLTVSAPLDRVATKPRAIAAASPATPTGERAARVLQTVLDDLGAAHQRPFSRG